MDLNEKPLSSREHDELRASVVGGVVRMRAARARRMQLAGAASAFVLVAAVVGGVLLGTMNTAPSDPITTPTPTPTQTPTPSPTSSSTPAPEPATALPAFGGDCAAAVDTALLSDVLGAPMELYPTLWPDPAVSLAGGLDCMWWEQDSYVNPSLSVLVYPATGGQPDIPLSCEQSETWASCGVSTTIDGAWITMTATGDVDASGMQLVLDSVADRVVGHDAPRAAERGAGWWTLPSCEDLAPVTGDPSAENMRASSAPEPDDADDAAIWAARQAATGPYRTTCVWETSVVSEGTEIQTSASLEVVPGGAASFDAIAASDGAEPVQVAGAEAAVAVRDNDRWEGYAPALVVKDGVNLLILRGYHFLPASELAPLVQPLLAYLDAGLA